MMAYTAAAKQNGSKYIPLMTNINKVSVLEKGTLCGAVMTGDYNLIEATYKSTLQKLVNRVLITDKNNNVIKTVEDAASIQKYGLVQRVLKQNDGEDATCLLYTSYLLQPLYKIHLQLQVQVSTKDHYSVLSL